jgi:glycosyltransferase involved in cell wall biosynthesis
MSDVVRVLHVAPQLETGGMERLLVEFARHADRRRFALRFAALGARGTVADEIEACGWSVTALGAPPGVRVSIMLRLARLIRDERTDIVHTHNTKPLLYAGPAARLAGHRNRGRGRTRGVIHTRHGQRHGATARQDVMFGLASYCADRMVCVSEDSARRCLGDRTTPRRIRTIHNGIDLERFAYAGPAAEGPAVFVGRLTPEKDVATLLHATAIVAENRASFRLKIAGAGPCEAGLTRLTNALGLDAHVEFLGEVRDVPALFRRSSLLVLPSVTEGLPLTVLEAMACGLPVVATRVGGTPEAVADGDTGLLVPAGDPNALAAALLDIQDDAQRARRMGLAGCRRVAERFDVRTMVARYQSLYEEVLGVDQVRAA